MKILTRYICGEILLNFEISLATISGMLLFVEIARYISSVGSSMGLFAVLPFLFPKIFEFSLPLAVLLGTLLTFSRLSADNEIHAMYTFRISLTMILIPVMLLSGAITLFSIANSQWVAPWCSKVLVNMRNHMAIDMVLSKLKEESYFVDKSVSVLKLSATPNQKQPILIYRNEGSTTQEILAEDFEATPDYEKHVIQLQVKNANISILDAEDLVQKSISGFSGQAALQIDFASKLQDRRSSEKSFQELLRSSKDAGASDLSRRKSLYDFHRKLASAFSCILLSLFGVFMGLRLESRSKIVGISFVIGLILLVYLPSIVMGKWLVLDFTAFSIPCWVGGWLSFFLIAIITFLLKISAKSS